MVDQVERAVKPPGPIVVKQVMIRVGFVGADRQVLDRQEAHLSVALTQGIKGEFGWQDRSSLPTSPAASSDRDSTVASPSSVGRPAQARITLDAMLSGNRPIG